MVPTQVSLVIPYKFQPMIKESIENNVLENMFLALIMNLVFIHEPPPNCLNFFRVVGKRHGLKALMTKQSIFDTVPILQN